MANTPDVFSAPSEAGESWHDIHEEVDSSRDEIESLSRTISGDCASVHSLPSCTSSYAAINSIDGQSDSDDFEHLKLVPLRTSPRGFVMVRYPSPIVLNRFLPSTLPRGGLRLKTSKKHYVLKNGFCTMRPPRNQFVQCQRRLADDNPWVALFAQMSVGKMPPQAGSSLKAQLEYKKAYKNALKKLRGEFALTMTEMRQKSLTGPKKVEEIDDAQSEISVMPNLLTNEQAATIVQPTSPFLGLPPLSELYEMRAAAQTAKSEARRLKNFHPPQPLSVRGVSAASVQPAGIKPAMSWASAASKFRPDAQAMEQRRPLKTSRALNDGYGDKIKVVAAEDFAYIKASMEGKFTYRAPVRYHAECYEENDQCEEGEQRERKVRFADEASCDENTPPMPHNVLPAALDLPATYSITRRG